MNILKIILNYPVTFFNETILKHFTDQQKTVIKIALAIFISSYVTYFIFMRWKVTKNETVNAADEKVKPKAQAVLNATNSVNGLYTDQRVTHTLMTERTVRTHQLTERRPSGAAVGSEVQSIDEQYKALDRIEPVTLEGIKTYQGKISSAMCRGEIKDGQLIGRGRMTFPNGDIYEGRFKNNLLNGLHGKMILICGVVFEGKFADGFLQGKGKKTFSDGTVYKGEFKGGCLNGQGEIRTLKGECLTGHFQDDLLNGIGEIKQINGNWYRGTFKDNHLNGPGSKYVSSTRTTFTGNFKDDNLHGTGCKITRDGTVIEEGEFEQGSRKGLLVDKENWLESKTNV